MKHYGIEQDIVQELTPGNGVVVEGIRVRDSGIVLGSDANGDIYFNWGGPLTRLAIGAPNARLYVNPAGNAPEWRSVGTAISYAGSFTKYHSDSSATVISGIPFQPTVVFCFAVCSSSASFGVSSSLINQGIAYLESDVWVTAFANSGSFISLTETAAGTQAGNISSFGANGFTITWSSAGAYGKLCYYYYIALQ